MMYAAAGGSALVGLVAAQAGGWWLALSLLAWLSTAYSASRGSELLAAAARNRGRR